MTEKRKNRKSGPRTHVGTSRLDNLKQIVRIGQNSEGNKGESPSRRLWMVQGGVGFSSFSYMDWYCFCLICSLV